MLDHNFILEQFPQLKVRRNNKPIVYLDSAATTLKPRVVIDRIQRHYSEEVANVHRGAHLLSDEATSAYEHSRQVVASFLGAHESEIVFTRGTTESLNLVASSYAGEFLKEGDEILLTHMEHHSNIVPWQIVADEKKLKIRYIPLTTGGELDFSNLSNLLNAHTKLVSLTYLSNALGTINPIKKIIQAAHAVGAKVVIDAAQAVAAVPVDVKELNCDFLAFSGHKIFGPTGVGVLYGKKVLLEQMPPYQGGGSMISTVHEAYSEFLSPPQRFEAGTPPIAEALGLASALKFVQDLGFANIQAHERALFEYAEETLSKIEGLNRYGQALERANIFSFLLKGVHPSDVGAILNEEGIAVRAGHHCCQLLMKSLGVVGTVRASFSIYNTLPEVDRLVTGIRKASEILK